MIQIPELKVLDVIKLEKNSQVIVTGGANVGHIGRIDNINNGTFVLPKMLELILDNKTIKISIDLVMVIGKEKPALQIG